MQLPDSKLFRYRFDFSPKPLAEFIRERYVLNGENQHIERLINERVRINGEKVDAEAMLNPGDWLEYEHWRSDEHTEKVSIPILYEDDWLLAVSKPDFLPVTPSTSYYFNSMAILLRERFDNVDLSPVHRLDIETSGVLLLGKTKQVRSSIQIMFQEHRVEKAYQAVVFNVPEVESISGDLVLDDNSKIYTKLVLKASKHANSLTLIEKQEQWGEYTRVWLKPITGKTNQIRAHLAAIGCPIVGDKKYYPDESVFLDWFKYRDTNRILSKVKLERQALHCESLAFINPFTHQALTIHDQSQSWKIKINSLLEHPETGRIQGS